MTHDEPMPHMQEPPPPANPPQGLIQVDVWGGTLHQNLIEECLFESWQDAMDHVREMVEAGCLCNILHTDYRMPEAEKNAAMEAVLAGLAAEHLPPPERTGFVVASGDGKRWRTMRDGDIIWTTDVADALTFARRRDADAFAAEDEDAWRIQEVVIKPEILDPPGMWDDEERE